MNHWSRHCTVLRAAIAVVIVLSGVASSYVTAQTLVEPNPKSKSAQPAGPAKQQSGLRTKSCNAFGAGFVQLPGTDTCVKVGGFVTMESTVNHGR
jgi:hypothetical protein